MHEILRTTLEITIICIIYGLLMIFGGGYIISKLFSLVRKKTYGDMAILAFPGLAILFGLIYILEKIGHVGPLREFAIVALTFTGYYITALYVRNKTEKFITVIGYAMLMILLSLVFFFIAFAVMAVIVGDEGFGAPG